jgi:CrcB protein
MRRAAVTRAAGRWGSSASHRLRADGSYCSEQRAMQILGIAVLGALGALTRNTLDGWVADRTGGAFPWGTFVINVSGSIALGFLFTLFTERAAIDPALRFSITTGFLGAYTTFSTFSLETVRLLQNGELGAAAGNVVLNVGLGLTGVYAGIVAARAA